MLVIFLFFLEAVFAPLLMVDPARLSYRFWVYKPTFFIGETLADFLRPKAFPDYPYSIETCFCGDCFMVKDWLTLKFFSQQSSLSDIYGPPWIPLFTSVSKSPGPGLLWILLPLLRPIVKPLLSCPNLVGGSYGTGVSVAPKGSGLEDPFQEPRTLPLIPTEGEFPLI